jgi:hypothetical protein
LAIRDRGVEACRRFDHLLPLDVGNAFDFPDRFDHPTQVRKILDFDEKITDRLIVV